MNVYERTLDVLDRRGWHQGGSRGEDGSVCLVAALYDASERAVGLIIDLWRLREALGLGCTVHAHRQLWQWQDCPNTTEEDVRLLLKYAAAEEAA